MTERITSVAEATILPGKLEAFKEVAAKLIQNVQANEPGTLVYTYHMNEDETKCTVIEHYQDSAAVLTHLVNFGPLAEEFLSTCEFSNLTLYGNPSADLSGALADFGPGVYPFYAGVVR
ncbi:putative quinol monooxygenase [Thermodesulfobacteriota bacterium]